MKISTKWIKEYVKFDLSTDDLVAKLNLTGTEVESVSSGLDDNIVVAKILKIEKHPNADRLQIAFVTDGKNEYKVVCGAPNIAVGQRVPFAKIGAKLPEFEIKKSVIRGEESEGMLCAEDELGLGEDHSGIIVLPENYKVGSPFNSYISGDVTLDLEITPNRGDCLSHVGMAREIGAIVGAPVIKKPISLDMNSANINDKIIVAIEGKDICQQYMARLIEGVKIGPSPKWLQDKLIAVGAKPINNVVDVTNYIMLDLGQPLHAFDADTIKGKEIIVRKSKENEKITTLDGVERKLKDNALITDKTAPIAIAGIMGGKNTEVTNNTTNILLESAEFDRKAIRKSAKNLSLVTEASYRFERGIDSGNVEYALNKAAKMIEEVAGGRILSGIAKAGAKPEVFSLKMEYDKINKLTGLSLAESDMNRILNSLGFEVKNGIVNVPLWRHDIEQWQDIAEEIARINGYDKITPLELGKTKAPKRSDFYAKEAIKNVLTDSGLTEVMNYPYLSEADATAAKLDTKNSLEIINPIQPENKYLRNSIIPGLLKSVAKNPAFDSTYLFEIGKVFSKKEEKQSLGIITAGKNAEGIMKVVVERLLKILKAKSSEIKIIENNKEDLLKFKVKKLSVFTAELELSENVLSKIKDLDKALNLSKKRVNYRPVSKFPSITRDLAFIVADKSDTTLMQAEMSEVSELISWVELFDEFASDKFGKGMKNVAFHINIQHPDKTMTDKEADKIIKDVITTIENKFKAKLRT